MIWLAVFILQVTGQSRHFQNCEIFHKLMSGGFFPWDFHIHFFISVRNWRPFGLALAKQVEDGNDRM